MSEKNVKQHGGSSGIPRAPQTEQVQEWRDNPLSQLENLPRSQSRKGDSPEVKEEAEPQRKETKKLGLADIMQAIADMTSKMDQQSKFNEGIHTRLQKLEGTIEEAREQAEQDEVQESQHNVVDQRDEGDFEIIKEEIDEEAEKQEQEKKKLESLYTEQKGKGIGESPSQRKVTQVSPYLFEQSRYPVYSQSLVPLQQVVSKSDFREITKDEDFKSYVDDFEASYIMQYDDSRRIQELVTRLNNNPIIKAVAKELAYSHSSWEKFKQRLIRAASRDRKEIYQEFKSLKQEDKETVTKFLDRLHLHLSASGQFKGYHIVQSLYEKLPGYYKEHIDVFELDGDYQKLRERVSKIQTDSVHRKLREVLTQQEKSLSLLQGQDVEDSANVQNSNYNDQEVGQVQQTGRGQATRNPGRGRGGRGRGFNLQGRGNQQINQGQQQQGNQNVTQGYVGEYQAGVRDIREQFHNFNISEAEAALSPQWDVFAVTRSEARKRNMEQINEELPQEEDIQMGDQEGTSRQQQQPQQEDPRVSRDQQKFAKTDRQRERTPPRAGVRDDNRGFQYFQRQQPTQDELRRQIIEQKLNQEGLIILDKGIFTDEQGNVNVTRMIESIVYPTTIKDYLQMEAKWRQGQMPIYSNMLQEEKNSIEDQRTRCKQNGDNEVLSEIKVKDSVNVFPETISEGHVQAVERKVSDTKVKKEQPREGVAKVGELINLKDNVGEQLLDTMLRSERKGDHLFLEVKLNGKATKALIDTGAVRSLISETLVHELELTNDITKYFIPPRFVGISGGTEVVTYVKSLQMQFDSQTVVVHMPIVKSSPFSLILGQDILLYTLKNVVIQVQSLRFCFDLRDGQKEQEQIVMPLQKQEVTSMWTCATYESYETWEDIFPGLQAIQGQYDLILADLPFKLPAFYQSIIPYSSYGISDFTTLGTWFQVVTKPDSILLMWASSSTLEQVLQLIKCWGYEYVGIVLTWVKERKQETINGSDLKLGLGYWTRTNSEILIMAKKGKISKFRAERRNVSQVFYAKPGSKHHSSKPIPLYQILFQIFKIQEMSNLELFARNKDSEIQKIHFDLYGDEIEGIFKPCLRNKQEVCNMLYLDQAKVSENIIKFLPKGKLAQFSDFIGKVEMEDKYREDERVLGVLARQFEAFDYDGKVGCAKNRMLDLELRPKAVVAKIAPPRYDSKRMDFLIKKTDEWRKKGFIEKGPVQVISNAVIVDKKGSEPYRVCWDFRPLNEVLVDIGEDNVNSDVEQIISEIYGMNFICVLDCKDAHNTLVATERTRRLLGLRTPIGILRSTRGQFGLTPMAREFNWALAEVLADLRGKGVFAYADDITLVATDLGECLELLEETLKRLRINGYVINHKKVQLFQTETNILGQVVGNDKVSIDPNRIRAIQELAEPTNKKSLQKFIGTLNYLRKYIPNLSSLLAPLYGKLKQGKDKFKLSEIERESFKSLKQTLIGNNVLTLPNLGKTFYMTISYNCFGYGAVLAQKHEDRLKPIAYRSKVMDEGSLKPQYLLKLNGLVQGIKEWRPIIGHQKLVVLTDNQILKMVLEYRGDNQQINRLLMKVMDINMEIRVKTDTYKQLKYSQLLISETNQEEHNRLDQLLTEYEKGQLVQKQGNVDVAFKPRFEKFTYTAYFDGACSRKHRAIPLGAYGFVIKDQNGQIISEKAGKVEIEGQVTNNVAESYSLLQLLMELETFTGQKDQLQIIGDSELILKQVKGEYKVNSNDLRVIQRKVRQLIRTFPNAVLVHVPRRYNEEANFLAQEKLKQVVNEELVYCTYQMGVVFQPDYLAETICIICGKADDEQSMFICDLCNNGQHSKCLGELVNPGKSYFFCVDCELYVQNKSAEGQSDDITTDVTFLEYLRDNQVRLSRRDKERCTNLERLYTLREEVLYYKDRNGLKKVPSISERHLLLLQVHEENGHSGSANLVHLIRQNYFWPNMVSETKQLVKSCLLCQAKRNRYERMPAAFPTYKGMGPWQFVSVDLMEIRDTQNSVFRYILACTCAFTKYLELFTLRDKKAETTAKVFRDGIMYRYGQPIVVRSDGGGEFKGLFTQQLKDNGSLHVLSSPYYPQSNGLIERQNRIIKDKLQSLYNSEVFRDSWDEHVQRVAFWIRNAKPRSTNISPHNALFHTDCLFPGQFTPLREDSFYEPSQEEILYKISNARNRMFAQDEFIRQNIQEMNSEIRQTIEGREILQITNMQFGQPVVIRVARSTHLNMETQGVNFFVKYTSNRKDSIVYFNPRSGRFLIANLTNVKVCDMS